ncbi:hypothetical protein GGS24DRAFT_286125 [Hypoxylon argillaceum]|nr:hypothetical protein GGS24DRAFT_286125 [Hypoxylon argillaceum]
MRYLATAAATVATVVIVAAAAAVVLCRAFRCNRVSGNIMYKSRYSLPFIVRLSVHRGRGVVVCVGGPARRPSLPRRRDSSNYFVDRHYLWRALLLLLPLPLLCICRIRRFPK